MGNIPLAVLERRRASGRASFLDVAIRCSKQPKGRPLSRPRFVFNIRELSGALGDLGTFLPHVLGAITVAGLSPTGVFVAFGLFYLGSGAMYGVPIAVQPMKAASASLLIQGMTPSEVVAGAALIGLFFLIAGAIGLVTWLAKITPSWVVGAIQLSLGSSLAWLGLKLTWSQPVLGLIVTTIMLGSLLLRKVPAALVGLAAGVTLAFPLGINSGAPSLDWNLSLPPFMVPTLHDFARAAYIAVLPQIPLTLTNALIVTAALARRYFPREEHHVTVRNLSLSTGIGNLVAACLGGYMMCHGSGGLAGHYRFGARTGGAPVIIGALFLSLGLFLGSGGVALLRYIPAAVVGSLLLFSGIELATASKFWKSARPIAGLAVAIAALGWIINLAVAFGVAVALSWLLRRWHPSLVAIRAEMEELKETCPHEDAQA